MSRFSHMSHNGASPKAKPTAVHSGMTRTQSDAMHVGGVGRPTESGAQPTSHPLTKPPLPKRQSAPQAHPSARHRHADALAGSKSDHARASRTLDSALGQKIRDQAAAHVGGSHVINDDPNGAC